MDSNTEFDKALQRAYTLLPKKNLFDGRNAINGVFALTPDSVALAGKVDGVQRL